MHLLPRKSGRTSLLPLLALLAGALASSLALAGEGDQAKATDGTASSSPATADGANSIDARLTQADQLARQGRLEDAVSLLRPVFQRHPDNQRLGASLARLMNARGRALLEQGQSGSARQWIVDAADLARQLVNGANDRQAGVLKAFLATAIYDQACLAAVAGQYDDAFVFLHEALEWGFDELERMTSDHNLASISTTARFQSLVENQRAVVAQRLREETLRELDQFESFDFDFQLAALDGPNLALGDYKGKIVIVDLWGTWCGPCRNEVPLFVRLKNELGDQGLEVIGLNFQEPGADEVRRTMEELQINYRCALAPDEIKSQIPDFEGFPTTLFIDGEGNVRMQLVGAHSFERLEAICLCLLDENRPSSVTSAESETP